MLPASRVGFSRVEVVEKIGFPDDRFFLYWDDAMYGLPRFEGVPAGCRSRFIMRRTREMKNWDIAGVRQLNSTSDNTRYYIMRNRGYMARYFQILRRLSPLCIWSGNLAHVCKGICATRCRRPGAYCFGNQAAPFWLA